MTTHPRQRAHSRALFTMLLSVWLLGCQAPDDPASVQDRYPGDARFTAKVQEMVTEVGADAITLTNVDNGRAITRAQLCRRLVARHFNDRSPGQGQTQADYLGCPDVDEAALLRACTAALATPDGYDGPEGWRRWAGTHRGRWYNDDGRRFDDRADWDPPRSEPTRVPGDNDASGRARNYDFQDVTWPNRRAGRRGWNQSHADVPYVWGWDPKDQGDAGGDIGTHVGFTFALPPCHFIIWLTPGEAFLEGINGADPRRRPKTSTGLFGRGQWVVQ